jgi:peptidylprolyl isomerase
MKHTALILLLAASTVAASAQPLAKPATTAAKPAVIAAKPAAPATASKSAALAAKTAPAENPNVAAIIKAPATIPVVKGLQKPIFTVALRYQEIKVGTGKVAETGKMYKVLYTGYRASDGVIFDASNLNRPPLRDKDGKPVMGDDGKPKLADAQPMPFVQGVGGTIPGFDQGFTGMKVGGKRRVFIPWQLAYGTRGAPARDKDHPGFPPKSDLIFDVELVDVTDAPPPQPRPGMMGGPRPQQPGAHPMPGAPGTPGAPVRPGTPVSPPAPGAAPAPGAPASGTPAAPNAAPAPAAAPKPAAAAPATTPAPTPAAAPTAPAAPQSK